MLLLSKIYLKSDIYSLNTDALFVLLILFTRFLKSYVELIEALISKL